MCPSTLMLETNMLLLHLVSFGYQVVEPNIEEGSLVDIAANLTIGDNSELTKLIQSGDLSRAVQLATAAIAAVDVNTQTQTVSHDELTEKRTEVIFSAISMLTCCKVQLKLPCTFREKFFGFSFFR